MEKSRLRRLAISSFKWGKYVIIYGSIFLLTILGIIVWIFGSINLFSLMSEPFSLMSESLRKWDFSFDKITLALQQVEAGAVVLLDICLLSVVLFIVAIGLYGIFINEDGEDEKIRLPVNITSIDDLERYLFGTIVAILLVATLDKILQKLVTYVEVGIICAIVISISIYLKRR